MKKIKTFLYTNALLLLLFVLAIGMSTVAFVMIRAFGTDKASWQLEFAKALLSLAMSAIIAGFIRMGFETYQKREAKGKAVKEFKDGLLNDLRSIFDKVDVARLLINAHKSAKTYGQMIRENILPSIVGLYDIKRSLRDAPDLIASDRILQIRVFLHFMIAYLQALVNEYEANYPELSRRQLFEEEIKKQTKEKFVRMEMEKVQDFFQENPFSDHKVLPELPRLSWSRMEELVITRDFIDDSFESGYRKMFVNFYEYSKRLLKGQEVKHFSDCWYDEKYQEDLVALDRKVQQGETITEADSVVAKLIGLLETNLSKKRVETLKGPKYKLEVTA